MVYGDKTELEQHEHKSRENVYSGGKVGTTPRIVGGRTAVKGEVRPMVCDIVNKIEKNDSNFKENIPKNFSLTKMNEKVKMSLGSLCQF